MCIFKKPKVASTPEAVSKEAVSTEDASATQNLEEKKRKGFSSTIATSGLGVTNQANVKKTQLGT